jgi:HK97 family phage prohead protease
MLELEHKYCLLGEDVTISDGTVISGYASLFGATDQGGDVVEAGAYKTSLGKVAAQKRNIKMLWQHDPAQPIGVWDEVREDKKGLWVKGRILSDVARGREAVALIEAGAIDGLSIGYRTVKAHKGSAGHRHLDEVELWEVSLVTFPMLPDARVGGKSDDPLAGHIRDLAAVFETARLNIPSL